MRLAELPARDEDEQVMLEVIVHPVRRHERARQEAGEHPAGVPQRVVVLGGQGVLGDVADASDDLIPRGERHEPQEQVDDHGPRVQHESRAAQTGHPAQMAKLGQGQDVPGDERRVRIGHAGIIAEREGGRRALRVARISLDAELESSTLV